MTDATVEQKPRPSTPHNPLTERLIKETVAAHPELSHKKCIELLIGPPAAADGLGRARKSQER